MKKLLEKAEKWGINVTIVAGLLLGIKILSITTGQLGVIAGTVVALKAIEAYVRLKGQI